MRALATARIAAAVLLCILPAAGAATAPVSAGERGGDADSEKIYFNLDIPLIGGGELTASELRGQILVVDVWGTWCGPCRHVIPHLIEIQEQFGPQGVKVIGISAEPGDDVEEATRKVLRYAGEMGMNYSLGIFDPELYAWIKSLMKFEGDSFTVPSTFVVDAEGAVIGRFPGYFPGQERELRQLLGQALKALKSSEPAGEGDGGRGAPSP